jgi:predicted dehydrogenase
MSVRWIVWGAGSIGRRHLRNLITRGEQDIVALRRTAEPLDGDLSATPVGATLADVRGRGEAAVIVCTPPFRHVADARAAIAAGCDVLVEKPLADSLAGVDMLAVEAARAGRIVGVGYCFRFHGTLDHVRAELVGGRLGDPLCAAVWCGQHLADWHPGRPYGPTYSARRDQGGGVLLDLSHEIDYLQWLLGPAEAVSAAVRNTGTLGIETEDAADLVLRLDGGVVGTCHLDYLARPAVRGGSIVCTKGILRWDLVRGTAERTGAVGWERVDHGGTVPDMYARELDAFAEAITARTPFPVGLDDGARAIRVALAARRASDERREIAV